MARGFKSSAGPKWKSSASTSCRHGSSRPSVRCSAAWLDSLGIEHGENGCADTFPPQPDAAALKKGVDVLLEKFDPQIVSIYLRTFNQIDETQWPALDEILRSEPRLQAKAETVASA